MIEYKNYNYSSLVMLYLSPRYISSRTLGESLWRSYSCNYVSKLCISISYRSLDTFYFSLSFALFNALFSNNIRVDIESLISNKRLQICDDRKDTIVVNRNAIAVN